MEITKKIAEYVAGAGPEDFPPEAVYAAKSGVMDCVACMLAGSREPLSDSLCQYVQANGGEPRATVVGRGFKTSAPEAALVNGAIGHALDYDDVARAMKGHPSVVLAPPALAVGEEEGATGREVLTAYMVGFEVACSVGAAVSPEFYDGMGWHPTGPLGALGACAAAAYLLKLDTHHTSMAISLAASQGAGLRQNFGTMTKPFHAGAASRAGVTAARLVQAGLTASTDGIEGRFGFLNAYSGGGGYDEAKVLDGLGRVSYLSDGGTELKKYPCCGSAHLALDVLLPMVEREHLDPSQVEGVEVRVDFDPPRSLIHDRPKTALEGRFSMQYCVAAALLDGVVGLGSFSDQEVMRPQAQGLFPKISMKRHAGFEGQPSWTENNHQVMVTLKDGRVLEGRTGRPPGRSLPGITDEELRAKFLGCAIQALPRDRADHALEALEGIEDVENIASVLDLVRG